MVGVFIVVYVIEFIVCYWLFFFGEGVFERERFILVVIYFNFFVV